MNSSQLFIVCLLGSLMTVVQCKEICCDAKIGCFKDDFPYDQMPLPDCPDVIQPSFRMYTRSNRDQGQVVTRTTIPPLFDGSKRTIFIVHGYTQNRNTNWLTNHKNTYLQRDDFNVIIVGWGGGAHDPYYPKSASNTRSVGAEIAVVAKLLVERGPSGRSLMWCVGHSLGAHTCGHAGRKYRFGRVTGLDPAGPWFENKDNGIGVDSGDFVDVIHTHGKSNVVTNLGTMRPMGHVDFYPNGGGDQPGCIIDTFGRPPRSQAPPNPLVDVTPACSHNRALSLWRESAVSGCMFLAREMCDDPYNIPASCRACVGQCQVMGFDTEKYEGRGLYYFTTGKKSPFCQG